MVPEAAGPPLGSLSATPLPLPAAVSISACLFLSSVSALTHGHGTGSKALAPLLCRGCVAADGAAARAPHGNNPFSRSPPLVCCIRMPSMVRELV